MFAVIAFAWMIKPAANTIQRAHDILRFVDDPGVDDRHKPRERVDHPQDTPQILVMDGPAFTLKLSLDHVLQHLPVQDRSATIRLSRAHSSSSSRSRRISDGISPVHFYFQLK